jgi:hypothetical protein
MLQVPWILMLIHGIPEALLFVLGIYVVSEKEINKKIYFLSSLIYFVGIYLIRLLPIGTGVNTLLIIVLMVIVSIKLIGITFSKSIIPVIVTTVTIVIGELINAILLQLIYGNSYTDLLKEPLSQSVYLIPSTVIMFVLIAAIYFIKKMIKNKKGKNGEVSTDNSK